MATSRDWQCDKSLTECLAHMFKANIATDVTFRVGAEEKVIHVHKFILISRSPVFYAMLEGPLSEKGEITIPDINENTFYLFIRYLYTDQIQLDVHNVISVSAAAKKYCVDMLVKNCDTFIGGILTPETAGVLLEEAYLYMDEEIKTACLQMIEGNPEAILRSKHFGYLSANRVESIIESDDLAVEEESVYEAVMRWSEEECSRQGLEVTDENRRIVLGDILFTVRFPLIQIEYLTKEIGSRDILTPAEAMTAIRLQNGKGTVLCDYILAKKRTDVRKTERVIRFDKTLTWFGKQEHATHVMSFSVSQNVVLYGICIYFNDQRSVVRIDHMTLFDENGQVLYKENHKVKTKEVIADVLLYTKVRLSHSHKYTLSLNLGIFQNQVIGCDGKTSVTVRSTDINFFDYAERKFAIPVTNMIKNGSCGIIAGLIFSGL